MEVDDEYQTQNLRKDWDHYREVPNIQSEKKARKLLIVLQFIISAFVGLLVFALGFFSKSSLLLLIEITNKDTVTTKLYTRLFLAITLVVPAFLNLIKALWKITFKDSKSPLKTTLVWVILTEALVGLAMATLILIAMPMLDILTNVMLLCSVAILSAGFQLVCKFIGHEMKRFIVTTLLAIVLILAGYVLFLMRYITVEKTGSLLYISLATVSTVCISVNWWENYSTLFKRDFLNKLTADLEKARNILIIVSSLVRILVTAIILVVHVAPPTYQDWSTILSISNPVKKTVLSLFAIQVASTALCHWFALVACKMHAVRRAFLIPMTMISPIVVVAIILTFGLKANGQSVSAYCQNSNFDISNLASTDGICWLVTSSLCNQKTFSLYDKNGLILLGLCLFCWWAGLVSATIYTWFLQFHRIERTRGLFVRRLYEAAFIDQSMMLNTKFEIINQQKVNRDEETVNIYLCATMWHETYDEMMKMIISMFRLDQFRPRRNTHNDVSFESHIFFDDAFEDHKDGTGRCVNSYAETLVEVVKEVYKIFNDEDSTIFKTETPIMSQKIIPTPYGARLRYTLPHGNLLIIHYKDKNLIRHKKRWSQIMYLYYLLGWKLNRKYKQRYYSKEDRNILNEELQKEKMNTAILALDGDTDFQPSAVMLLVDRLRLYPEVGAVCGRIHPTGTGPMVWYQKFEYAVGHWLQKSAEHVFGCVLCSPGCFSLFRAAALMDDNVAKKYTTTATEAGHYVQYDQGEDRWLCTLLLQQGWRVEYNAASDSYTNAPQEFKEFYNQRRRWGPSTMANTLDLLGTGTLTAQKNKSISKPYILYQIVTMAASILGPSTVTLMIAGCFSFVFKITPNAGLALAIVPPVIYLILCFKVKANTQISIAAVLSVCYAFLMTAAFLSIVGDMVLQGTFMTPSGLFLISMVMMYMITALLHPHEFHLVIYGFLYILAIPSGYLLLAIYSMVNMNNVSWGTREVAGQNKEAAAKEPGRIVKYEKKCKCCCWNVRLTVDEDEKIVAPVQATPSTSDQQVAMPVVEIRLEPPQEPIWINQLKLRSREIFLHEDKLDDQETQFWHELQEIYLKPLDEDKKKQKQIAEDLKDLRNKATFVYFIINALWLVATLFLQLIGSSVLIPIPKLYANGTVAHDATIQVDPIGLMFLLGFATLIWIQFMAMFWHRIQTLIHYIAYTASEIKDAKVAYRKVQYRTLEDKMEFSL